MLVGFHEKRSSYVADMRECRVLPPAVSDCWLRLRALIASLAIRIAHCRSSTPRAMVCQCWCSAIWSRSAMLTSPCCARLLLNTRCGGICNLKARDRAPVAGQAHTLGYDAT